ncbi:hypothetical protein FGIG_10609 [Fasciola gigantica]|uniref:Uncharacterized protein n=1 Tax=Fasciola gigantica TaxID=46835 RepID=A0A504YVA2_FASGI|nr:hypothetical protein FGIG_10609 [Fasciola gigantica]
MNSPRENAIRSLYRMHKSCSLLQGARLLIEQQFQAINTSDLHDRYQSVAKVSYYSVYLYALEKTHSVTAKHVKHVQQGLELIEKRECNTKLAKEVDVLMSEFLRNNRNWDETSLRSELLSVGYRAEREFLQIRAEEMKQQTQSRNATYRKSENLKELLISFRQKVAEKKEIMRRLRTENRKFSSALPELQSQAQRGKEAFLRGIRSTMDSIDRLLVTNPLQRVLDIPLDREVFAWKVNAQGLSINSLMHIAVRGTEPYEACCSVLSSRRWPKCPSIILHEIISLACKYWMRQEQMEFLRHVKMILEEESCTTSKLQKNDVKLQEKVRRHIEPQMRHVGAVVLEIKASLSDCKQFLSDWKYFMFNSSERLAGKDDGE